MKKFKENNSGFSLVELIVVIAIMVVLVAVLGSTILGYVDKSKYSKDITALDSINTAVKTFVADPSSLAGGTNGYVDGTEYTLDVLISSFDKGNVILPILSEVFDVDGRTNTATDLATVPFNAASKSFNGKQLQDVRVIIDNGAVSVAVSVNANSGGYAPYVAGTKYDKVTGQTAQ